MGKKNQVIRVIGIGTAIAMSQIGGVAAEQIAQSNDAGNTTEEIDEIIKPAQPSIEDTGNLNPSGNPLSFPTTPEEVEVDAQQAITLEQAVELSLKNNRQIEQARLEATRAEFELRQERAALFPTLDFTSGLSYGDSDVIFDSVNDEQIEQTALRSGIPLAGAEDILGDNSTFTFSNQLSLGYDIFTSGGRGASIRAAEKQLRLEELDLERIVEEIRLETASDYYELQNSDAQVEIQQAAVEDAQQTLKDAQLLERAGLGTRFDVLRAEVELAQAEQRLTTAIANQNIARRQLAETLSVSHSTDLTTADAIEEAGLWELELPETIVQAFKNRAELEQFLLQKEISQEQRTIRSI